MVWAIWPFHGMVWPALCFHHGTVWAVWPFHHTLWTVWPFHHVTVWTVWPFHHVWLIWPFHHVKGWTVWPIHCGTVWTVCPCAHALFLMAVWLLHSSHLFLVTSATFPWWLCPGITVMVDGVKHQVSYPDDTVTLSSWHRVTFSWWNRSEVRHWAEGGRHEAGKRTSVVDFSPQALQQVRPQWEVLAGLWTYRVISRRKTTLGKGE